MAGTPQGGQTAALSNKVLYGNDFYQVIGILGGSVSHPKTRAFSTNRELARKAGRKGGSVSRRGKRGYSKVLSERQARKIRVAEALRRLEQINKQAKRLREARGVV